MQRSALEAGRVRRSVSIDRLGYPTLLFIVWLVVEYGRPPNPMKIPYMISLTFLAGWLFTRRKLWNPQIVCSLLFVAQMAMMIPFAENNFTARMVTREAFVVIVCIAVPLAHLITTLRQYDVIIRSWVVVFAYMGIIAVLNGGIGPGGARGGVDENYTALFMTIAISNMYFMSTVARKQIWKLALLGAMILCAAAIVVGFSRGGFLGLVAVAGYCWWASPNRWRTLLVLIVLSPLVLLFVPPEYWTEVNTIGDTSETTADKRLVLWAIATRVFLDNPLFGVGPGNFVWVSGFYQAVDEKGVALGMNVTHSLYFELIAEMGISGVILLGTMAYFNAKDLRLVGRLYDRQRKRLKRTGDRPRSAPERAHLEHLRRAQAFASGLAGSFIGFFVCSIFLSTLYYTTFWILSALTVVLTKATRSEVARFGQYHEQDRGEGATIESDPTGAVASRGASVASLIGR